MNKRINDLNKIINDLNKRINNKFLFFTFEIQLSHIYIVFFKEMKKLKEVKYELEFKLFIGNTYFILSMMSKQFRQLENANHWITMHGKMSRSNPQGRRKKREETKGKILRIVYFKTKDYALILIFQLLTRIKNSGKIYL